jgi:DNA-binding NarL/FixJ family response regulator
MVITENVIENDRHNSTEIDGSTCQYVYLVDDAQKMMVILKRDLDEMRANKATAEETVKDFITHQMQGLLDRMKDNGPLSIREIEMLKYAALGKSNKEIGEILYISESTIKNHFSNILRKLNAHDRTHAVTLALYNGWLPGLSQK